MTHQSFEALISLLEQEAAIYEEMALLLDQEREALLGLALDRLGELTSRKETLGLRIKAMDESRKLLARRLGAAYGLAPDQVTLTTLGKLAPPDTAQRLGRIGQRLRETVERCQAVNDYNARAAHRGMDLVSGAIEYLIAQADPAGQVYQAPRPAGARGGYPPARRPGVGASGFISRQV